MEIEHFEFVKKEGADKLRDQLRSGVGYSTKSGFRYLNCIIRTCCVFFCISETKSATQPNAYMHVFATFEKRKPLLS